MQSIGITVFETALSWWGKDSKLKKLYHVEGLEHLQAAQQTGKGILLLGGHYTTLDISGNFLVNLVSELIPTYKPAHNKLFEAIMLQSRQNTYKNIIPSRDMRTIIRLLKNKGIVWYAPDQDFGREGSVFAPFMGVQATTLTLTSRLAKLSGAVVIPYSSRRLDKENKYVIRFSPAINNFPSNDEIADATQVNQAIASNIQLAPEQYLWVHRRFKTRPIGEAQLYPMRRVRQLRRYSKVLALLTIPAVCYTLWLAWRHKDRQYRNERLGLSQPDKATGHKQIWIHAASVGEVNAIIPLVELITNKHPELTIYFTTATPSGQMAARNKLPHPIHCHYLPIDWWFAVNKFLKSMQPDCAFIVETEIWPNLYEACYATGTPIIIVNGRISKRTLQTGPWIHSLYCKSMEYVHRALVRSEEDAQGFLKIQLPENKIKVIGNIKFSTIASKQVTNPIDLTRPYVLAASTRDHEEKIIVQQWRTHQQEQLLVIVPRHPKRLKNILNDLKDLNLNIAIRSRHEEITPTTQIYIADTFGELSSFIAGSQFVIMGGSFVPKGGQNILEAAQQAKAVIFGPHMDNFHDEARLFLQHHAGIQVKQADGLASLFNELLSNPEKTTQLGQNGLRLMQEQADIATRYLTEIEQTCKTWLN